MHGVRYKALPNSVKFESKGKIVDGVGTLLKLDENHGQYGFIKVSIKFIYMKKIHLLKNLFILFLISFCFLKSCAFIEYFHIVGRIADIISIDTSMRAAKLF